MLLHLENFRIIFILNFVSFVANSRLYTCYPIFNKMQTNLLLWFGISFSRRAPMASLEFWQNFSLSPVLVLTNACWKLELILIFWTCLLHFLLCCVGHLKSNNILLYIELYFKCEWYLLKWLIKGHSVVFCRQMSWSNHLTCRSNCCCKRFWNNLCGISSATCYHDKRAVSN